MHIQTQAWMDGWSNVLRPTRHKIGQFGDVLARRSVGSVLKNQTQQNYLSTKLTQKHTKVD